jgi:pimeloyl-ACP methyl ester carboxylesterase
MKTAIVIPGFKQQVRAGKGSRVYQPLLRDLRAADYTVIAATVTWDHHTITDWVREVEQQIAGVDTNQALLIGFSYGAMTASVLATRHHFGRVFLCSLSPYFAEDISRAKKSWLTMAGKRRIEAFKRLRFSDIVKVYRAAETVVFAGTFEMARRKAPVLKERGLAAGARLPGARFVAVPGAGHDISHPNYAAAIKAEL